MTNTKTQPNALQANDEEVIDLLELALELKRHILLILLFAVLGGGIAGAFSKFVMIPQFQSSSMMYILSKETTLTSLADLQIGSQLTNDYKYVVTSRPVLEEVIEKLGLDISYGQLNGKIKIENPTNTRILRITATDANPVRAKDIADTLATTSSNYIADTMEMVPPKIIETGVVATRKSSPSVSKNALIGAMVGVVAICGFIVMNMLLNDTIVTSEDVSKYLNITVLASVPVREGAEKEKDDKHVGGKKKSKRKG